MTEAFTAHIPAYHHGPAELKEAKYLKHLCHRSYLLTMTSSSCLRPTFRIRNYNLLIDKVD